MCVAGSGAANAVTLTSTLATSGADIFSEVVVVTHTEYWLVPNVSVVGLFGKTSIVAMGSPSDTFADIGQLEKASP
jgi:hypothetical protein